jgi:hypothetical protein
MLRSVRIQARGEDEDMELRTMENATREEVTEMVGEALADTAIEITMAADHEEGRWHDGERVIVARRLRIRVEYEGCLECVETTDRASDEEVHAEARRALGVKPEETTRLIKGMNHGACWQNWECVRLKWEIEDGPREVAITAE